MLATLSVSMLIGEQLLILCSVIWVRVLFVHTQEEGLGLRERVAFYAFTKHSLTRHPKK